MGGGIVRRFAKGIFVVANVAIAVLFLCGCYVCHFEPGAFWFLGLLTLASLWLLLILVLFIVFWLFAKPKYIFISIFAIAAAWYPLQDMIKMKLSDDFSLSKKTGSIRVMSWNIEHFDINEHKSQPQKKAEMLALINKYQPDIACFQEMVGSDFDSSAINYVPYIAKSLNFSNYFYTYNKKLDFDSKHHFGIIIFSKYPIIEKHQISYDPNNYNSIFQYIDIARNNDTFRIYNLHLQSLKFSDLNRRYIDEPTIKNKEDLAKSKSIIVKLHEGFLKRQVQSERVKKSMNESPYPLIVCGDFNDVPNSYAYCTIGKGMKNSFTEQGSGIGRTFSSISPTLRIDNIFTDQRFETVQYIRVKKMLSDHFPIVADLKFVHTPLKK